VGWTEEGGIRSAIRPTRCYSFRYNRRSALGWNDKDRVNAIAGGIEGKRLTYRRIDEAKKHFRQKARRFQRWRKRHGSND